MSQISQENVLSPWINACAFKLPLEEKPFPQTSQAKGFV